MNWTTVAIGATVIFGGSGVGGFLASAVMPIIRRPAIRADVAQKVTDAAARLINEMQEETATARQEATAARQEAADARREAAAARQEAELTRQALQEVTAEATNLATRFRSLVSSIHEPAMTLDQLRRIAPISASNHHHL